MKKDLEVINEYINVYRSYYRNETSKVGDAASNEAQNGVDASSGKAERNVGIFSERKEGGWQLVKGTHYLEDGGYYRVENSKPLPEVYDKGEFCWYEGDHENGVPNGQGKEYRIVKGKRVLLFQGTFKGGKKVRGNQFLDTGLFHTCEYRDGRPFASGWDDSTKKRIDKLIASKLDSQARDMTGTSFVELYRQENKDSRPIHVFTGYVTQQWKYVLGTLYTDDDENNPLYEGFFDAEGKFDGHGTFYLDRLYYFTGTFAHGVPTRGQLFMSSTLIYAGEVDEEYQMEGSGVLYYPVRNKTGARYVKYEGAFEKGAPCGFGKLFAKGATERGELEYCGYFKDGMFDGKGVMVAKDKLVMCLNPHVTLAGLAGCSREEFDQIQSVGEWADGEPKKGYTFLMKGESCLVKVEKGVVKIENYVNEKGETISGDGVEVKDGNGENVIDLGFMKVVWNGDVSVKSVKRMSNGEVTVEKRICMKNGRQEGEVSFRVNGVLVFKGCCVDGVPNGQGTMTGQNGESAKGEWRNGELVKGTIQVYRNGQWRTYTMDSMTYHFQYLGGFGQPISGKGNMKAGMNEWNGWFKNGEMVMGHEYIESTTPGMKWDVRCLFVVNGEKATLHYCVLDNSGKVYDSLVYGSCSIVNKRNGIVELAYEKEGEKVTQIFQCTPQQLEQVFSEDGITVDKRFRYLQLVERKTERGEGNVTSDYYYWNHQTIDYLNGLVYNAASRVVYQGGLEMSVEGALTVPVYNGKGKQYDGNEGLLYDGGWLNGKRNGQGKEYNAYEGLLYDGGWLNGKRNGQGVEYANGKKVYEGWWLNGMRNGEGTEYTDDAKWSGIWKNGKKEGKFITLFNGGMVEEIWSNGLKVSSVVTRKDGVKEVRRKVGRKEVTVEWNDGERTYRYANDGKMIVELVNGGKLYVGGVKKNQDSWWKKDPNHRYSKWLYVPNGYGEEYDENGVVAYRGYYYYAFRYGKGKEYVNGVKVFEGEFEYDCRKNGDGMVIYGEYQLRGKWKNGVKDGEFVMDYKNGLVFKTNYENGNNSSMWSVYDQKRLLYQGSLKGFLPENGNYYVILDGYSFPVPTDALRKEESQAIGDNSRSYCGHVAVENDFYCVANGEGLLFTHGMEYAGVFNTFDYISDCTVKREEKEVFFGIVSGQQFYAGFRYTNNCTEEGLFENGCLKHGYKLLNGNLCSVGDPKKYDKAYKSKGMTFRNKRRSIKASSESKGSLESKGQKGNPFGVRKDTDFCEGDNKQIPGLSSPQTGETNSGSDSANADEDGASSQDHPNSAFPTQVDQSPANLSSVNRASEEDFAKTVSPQPQPGSSNRDPIIPVSEQQQVPTPGPPSKGTSTYTLTKANNGYYLDTKQVSVEFEDNGATVLVPYNHENNEDNPATQIYLSFTCDGYKYTFVKAVIRMPSPLCSIKHPKSYSDAYTHEPPDRRRPPHAERRSSPQGCTRPTQYPAFARPCTP